MSGDPCVIFAGGGSGGHLSPGLAIHERLQEISPQSKSIFVCSTRAIDATMLGEAGVTFVPIPAVPPSRKPAAAVKFLLNHRRSKAMVRRLIREHGVTAVITLGGFVAPSVVSAAKSANIPVLVMNLDNPPGRANQWMAKRANLVLSAVPLPDRPGFAKEVVGMPIRRRAIAPGDAVLCRRKLGLDPSMPVLLITGASQGATSMNQMFVELARTSPGFFDGWQVLHLAGHGADDAVREAYTAAGVKSVTVAFLNEMGLAWGAADLAVSRAGASSVAEAAANAVPTVFLPYPYHADMHQKFNAQPLVDQGGAIIVMDKIDAATNVRETAPAIQSLMQNAQARAVMRERLRSAAWPDAALRVAQTLASGF